jgi:hypothetical protein
MIYFRYIGLRKEYHYSGIYLPLSLMVVNSQSILLSIGTKIQPSTLARLGSILSIY